jgi:thioredoxin reductase (NADPH)
MITGKDIYDCIVIGAGPGGLQGALHLARFNRKVLVLDRGGGRTRHAKHMVNYLGHPRISGSKLIDVGLDQVKSFGVKVSKGKVDAILKQEYFSVQAAEKNYEARFIICASGASENISPLQNLGRFFADSVFTCVTCDGYLTSGKKLAILGSSGESVRLALGMKQMFTDDITLVLTDFPPPEGTLELLAEENVRLILGRPHIILGEEKLRGVQLVDNTIIECEVVMLSFGTTLNDLYLKNLKPKRNEADGKFLVNSHYESSVSGLYLTGSLCQGHAQAIIAAGQGAAAAIDINGKLLLL